MNRNDLITKISTKLDCTKNDAELFIRAYEEVLIDGLARGEKIRIFGVGTLSVIEVPDKNALNPQNGEKIVVKAHNKVKFKVAKEVKQKVKG